MVTADEVGMDVELGGVRARIGRSRLFFGGMGIAICYSAIGLGRPVDGQRGHTVDAAKVAGSREGKSVRSGVGWCGKNCKIRSDGLSGPA